MRTRRFNNMGGNYFYLISFFKSNEVISRNLIVETLIPKSINMFTNNIKNNIKMLLLKILSEFLQYLKKINTLIKKTKKTC